MNVNLGEWLRDEGCAQIQELRRLKDPVYVDRKIRVGEFGPRSTF